MKLAELADSGTVYVTFNFYWLIPSANVGIAKVGVTGSRYAV